MNGGKIADQGGSQIHRKRRAYSYQPVVLSARKRRMSRRKSPSRSPSRKRWRSPYKTFAKKVMAVVNKNAEPKAFDIESGAIDCDFDGTMVQVTAIPDGVLRTERVGTVVNIQKIEMRGFVDSDEVSTTTGKNDLCRVILFRYNHDHTATPAVAEVIEQVGTIDAATSPLVYENFKPKNQNSGDSPMTVLYDSGARVIGDQQTGTSKIVFQKVLTFRNPITCSYTGATAADEGPGQIYMCLIGSHAPSTNLIDGRFTFRVWFTDV